MKVGGGRGSKSERSELKKGKKSGVFIVLFKFLSHNQFSILTPTEKSKKREH